MQTAESRHIEASADLSRGRARIAGTRVRVQDIVACHEFQGMSADEIVAGYPQITLADVYAALTYYHDHRDEIRLNMKDDEEFVARFRQQQAQGSKDADGASLPS